MPGHTFPLPGAYPHIINNKPALKVKGRDNLGMGYTQHGEQFLLKEGGLVGIAEFVAAKMCEACGLPVCTPTVVTIERFGQITYIFGSRIEAGLRLFDQSSVLEWQKVTSTCLNPSAFSALFAMDLALGNDDRHWDNWLVQDAMDAQGNPCLRLRAVDFSRGWPLRHPAQHPLHHISQNTWDAFKDWGMLGVQFDQSVFSQTCAKIQSLDAHWLRDRVLGQLTGIFLTSAQADQYCQWWSQHWRAQVDDAIDSLENGVRP